MPKLFLTILPVLFVTSVFGQKMNSIKYTHDHLYFHEYGTGEPVIILPGGPGANYQQMQDSKLTKAP